MMVIVSNNGFTLNEVQSMKLNQVEVIWGKVLKNGPSKICGR